MEEYEQREDPRVHRRLRYASHAKMLFIEWLRLAYRLVVRANQSGPAIFEPIERDTPKIIFNLTSNENPSPC